MLPFCYYCQLKKQEQKRNSNNISCNLCIAREVLFNLKLLNKDSRSNSKEARAVRKFEDQKISFFIKYTFEFYGVGKGCQIGPTVKVLYFLKTASTTGLVSVRYGPNLLHCR